MDERRDDWHHGVDENLASLNTGQRVNDRAIKILEVSLRSTDKLLRGDPEKDTAGLIARLHDIETQLAKMNAVIFVDSTGKRGLVHEVEALSTGERTAEQRWKFATAIVVAILSLLGLLITNWDRISAYLGHAKLDPLDQAIESARHPKPKHRHYIIKDEPTESE